MSGTTRSTCHMPHVVSSVRLTALCFAVSQFGSCLNHISHICIYIYILYQQIDGSYAGSWAWVCVASCSHRYPESIQRQFEVYLLAIFELQNEKEKYFKVFYAFYKSNLNKFNHIKIKFRPILLSSVAGKQNWDAKWLSKWLCNRVPSALVNSSI